MKILLSIFAFVICVSIGYAEKPNNLSSVSAAKVRPFWLSSTMDGESVLFIKDGDAAVPKASVFFRPTKILSVCNASGEVVYVEGRDYYWRCNEREISLPAGSRIPFRSPSELRRAAGSQRYQLTHRDGNGEILFGAEHEYHDMQTLITYEHKFDAWSGHVPIFADAQLPLTIGKLKEGQPLTIALLGDSISTGCNASGWAKTPPFQPPYQDLLVMALESAYCGKVSLKNYSVIGKDAQWGQQYIDKILETDLDPDLVILAFGMNDAIGRSAAQFQASITEIIKDVRKANPNAEFILVAPMLGNPDWITLQSELFPKYRNALAELCGQGVVLADMTSIWNELLKHKAYCDMTGNGVNHPNDFGHRIYADVLSQLLIRNL